MSPPLSRRRFAWVVGALSACLIGAWALAAGVGVEGVDWRAALLAGTPDHAIVVEARLGRALLGSVDRKSVV